MLKKQKSKNYAELENARVFHNPKTDLIEITGKYVDGGNFSVVLPQGTKSDIKVRTELERLITEPEQTLPKESPEEVLYNGHIHYGNPTNVELAKSGTLYYQVGSEWNWFCLPELSPGNESLFPLGIDVEGQPISINLKAQEKNNIFLSNHPGSGGLMTLANLVYHVINFMPDTHIVHTNDELFLGISPTDEKTTGRMENLQGLFLLDHLRKLRDKMVKSPHGSTGVSEVIFLQDFELLVDGEFSNGPSARTDKAVRAEILDLILEISAINRVEYNVCFVFSSRYLSDSMNAFLETAGTAIAYVRNTKRYQEPSEPRQYQKVFGRELSEMYAGNNGRGIIKDTAVGRPVSSRKFATFLNDEVVKSFADPVLQNSSK